MRQINLSKLININIQDQDKWLLYQLEKIQTWTDSTQKKTAYCYSNSGQLNIFISHDIIRQGKELLLETIKHEIYHGYYGHLHSMLNKQKRNRQLLNILFDCSIHEGPVNHNIFLTYDMTPCTYKRCKLPVLPPLVLYEKLKNNIPENFISDYLNDDLWKQKPISELEQAIIQNTIESALDEAIKNKVSIPTELTGSSEKGQGRDSFEMIPTKNPSWLKQLRNILKDYSQGHKTRSWRREPRQEIGSGILKRGLANSKSETKFLFAIDCSGSMHTKDIQSCVSAIHSASVREGLQGKALFFDTSVEKSIDIRDKEGILDQVKKYGGGTQFQCVLDFATETDILVFWTDGGAWDIQKLNTDKFIHKPIFLMIGEWHYNWFKRLGTVIPVKPEDLNNWR